MDFPQRKTRHWSGAPPACRGRNGRKAESHFRRRFQWLGWDGIDGRNGQKWQKASLERQGSHIWSKATHEVLPPEGEGARRADGGCSIQRDPSNEERMYCNIPHPALRATFPLRGKDLKRDCFAWSGAHAFPRLRGQGIRRWRTRLRIRTIRRCCLACMVKHGSFHLPLPEFPEFRSLLFIVRLQALDARSKIFRSLPQSSGVSGVPVIEYLAE